MNEETRLSRLETLWSVVHRAHGDQSIDARAAREEIMSRYGGAVRKYLLGALRDEEAADEVFQEFSLRMARGDFHRADPDRGQFRKFVKTALFRMIVDYQRQRGKSAAQFDLEHAREPVDDDPHGDAAFAQSWRRDLIEKTLTALEARDRKTGSHLFTVLQVRLQNPEMRSPELAELAGQSVNKSMSADNFRAILRRARVHFASLLLDEVAHSLTSGSPEELEAELAELDLLEYCRPALEQTKPEH